MNDTLGPAPPLVRSLWTSTSDERRSGKLAPFAARPQTRIESRLSHSRAGLAGRTATVHIESRYRMTSVQNDLQQEVAALLVEALNLDVSPDSIDPQAPLYGEGLGLDSIDILEVALVVSKKYGFQLRSDDEDNVRIFTSLSSLVEHIATHRTV